MKNIIQRILTITGAAVMLCTVLEPVNAEDPPVTEVNHTVTELKGGDYRHVVFVAPEDYPWDWKMKAITKAEWSHRPGTQIPDNAQWTTHDFEGSSGYWTATINEGNLPEKNFQVLFYGKLSKSTEPGPGDAPEYDFHIEAAGGEYRVLPDPSFICVDEEVTLKALGPSSGDPGGESEPIPSYWSLPPGSPENVELTPSEDKTRATFTASEPGEYTVEGESMANSEHTDTASVTAVEVDIYGPSLTTEGMDSGLFTLTVQPDHLEIDGYQWSAQWPEDVGHEPSANFENPEEKETKVLRAKWFAEPNERWESETGVTCAYDIMATVRVLGQDIQSAPWEWTVKVLVAGFVSVDELAKGIETVEISQDPIDGLYYVTGQGDFKRIVDVMAGPTVTAPETSDFHEKFMAHEEYHIEQWDIDPWASMWDVDTFYAEVLSQLPGQATEQDLWDLIQAKYGAWDQESQDAEVANHCEREAQAYEHEYNFNPRYLEIKREEVPSVENCMHPDCLGV